MRTIRAFRHDRRQSPRTELSRSARLRLNEWSRLTIEVANISRDGFNAQADILPKSDAYVTLEVPGIGWVEARVMWLSSDGFGAKFLRPIDLNLCAWTVDNPVEIDGPAADEIAQVARLLASRVAETTASSIGETDQ